MLSRRWIWLLAVLCMAMLLSACGGEDEPTPAPPATQPPPPTIAPTQTPTPTPTFEAPVLAPTPDRAAQIEQIPALVDRFAAVDAALALDPPILALTDGLDDDARRAQDLAIADADFQQFVRDPNSGAPLRNEIFSVYPMRDSDITDATAACATQNCYRVEMYNYALNLMMVAFVDVDTDVDNQAVLDVVLLPDSQPELPPYLVDLAMQIAWADPLVEHVLGFVPNAETVMPSTKTALKNTTCERSKHLCVAPTVVVDNRALWAIVDMTDARVVGVQWTNLGASIGQWPVRPTEDEVRKQSVFERFCRHTLSLDQDGWQMDYIITSSDGLRISDVTFQGKPVLDSAKLVDWHVQYSTQENFGYSDGIGCPMFSSSAVVAIEDPYTEPILAGDDGVVADGIGFALIQDFYHPIWPQPCNYRYQQRYEFYKDGRFRVVAQNLGRGCGTDGVYRPIIRIDLANPEPGGQTLSAWDGSSWRPWRIEGWTLQDTSTLYTEEGYQFRVTNTAGDGYYIEPGRAQFGDGGRGDNAFTYVTVHHPEEGDADMPTLGTCCNSDYHQGPIAFVEPQPEALAGHDLVLWYVPQQENDERPGLEYCWADFVLEDGVYAPKAWPCAAGPMFVPMGE
ncbi:MAG: hypothetical protein R2873_08355 [Caldilineaceae bacterium]